MRLDDFLLAYVSKCGSNYVSQCGHSCVYCLGLVELLLLLECEYVSVCYVPVLLFFGVFIQHFVV